MPRPLAGFLALRSRSRAYTLPGTASPWTAGKRTSRPSRPPTGRRAPPRGEIVFVGSSTIRLWDLAASFPDLKTINRGFGGSEMSDSVRLRGPHRGARTRPGIVVVYAGDNDIMGMTSEQITIEFERFVRAVHAKLPATRILYIGIKPSLLRWAQVDRMRPANVVIEQFCERDDRLAFVDVDHAHAGLGRKAAPRAVRRGRPAPHARGISDSDRARAPVPDARRRSAR